MRIMRIDSQELDIKMIERKRTVQCALIVLLLCGGARSQEIPDPAHSVSTEGLVAWWRLVSVSAFAQNTSESVSAGAAISPYLVGANVWHNPNDDVWQVSSQAGLQIVRIGGGAYDRRMPSNEQLMQWCQQIRGMNAEPMIQVSQYLSSRQAAAIVQFFNVDKNMGIKFWNIGNETWLRQGRPSIETVPALVAKYVKPLASAMKSVDPSIRIFVCDECDYFDALYEGLISGPSDLCGKDEHGRYYIDGFSWHRYVSGDRDWVAKNAAEDFRARAAKCRALVDRANVTHGRVGEEALEWGIGEFNLENKGYAGPSTTEGSGVHSFVNGQFFAEVYGICMKYGATYACPWSMFEHGGRRSGTDFSFLDGQGLTPRPSFRHMQLIAENFRGSYADGSTSQPNIRAFGCKSNGQYCALILNMEAKGQKTYTLRFDRRPIRDACAINIDAGEAIEYQDAISNQTTQLLVFNANGQLLRKSVYGLEQAKAGSAPLVVEAD